MDQNTVDGYTDGIEKIENGLAHPTVGIDDIKNEGMIIFPKGGRLMLYKDRGPGLKGSDKHKLLFGLKISGKDKDLIVKKIGVFGLGFFLVLRISVDIIAISRNIYDLKTTAKKYSFVNDKHTIYETVELNENNYVDFFKNEKLFKEIDDGIADSKRGLEKPWLKEIEEVNSLEEIKKSLCGEFGLKLFVKFKEENTQTVASLKKTFNECKSLEYCNVNVTTYDFVSNLKRELKQKKPFIKEDPKKEDCLIKLPTTYEKFGVNTRGKVDCIRLGLHESQEEFHILMTVGMLKNHKMFCRLTEGKTKAKKMIQYHGWKKRGLKESIEYDLNAEGFVITTSKETKIKFYSLNYCLMENYRNPYSNSYLFKLAGKINIDGQTPDKTRKNCCQLDLDKHEKIRDRIADKFFLMLCEKKDLNLIRKSGFELSYLNYAKLMNNLNSISFFTVDVVGDCKLDDKTISLEELKKLKENQKKVIKYCLKFKEPTTRYFCNDEIILVNLSVLSRSGGIKFTMIKRYLEMLGANQADEYDFKDQVECDTVFRYSNPPFNKIAEKYKCTLTEYGYLKNLIEAILFIIENYFDCATKVSVFLCYTESKLDKLYFRRPSLWKPATQAEIVINGRSKRIIELGNEKKFEFTKRKYHKSLYYNMIVNELFKSIMGCLGRLGSFNPCYIDSKISYDLLTYKEIDWGKSSLPEGEKGGGKGINIGPKEHVIKIVNSKNGKFDGVYIQGEKKFSTTEKPFYDYRVPFRFTREYVYYLSIGSYVSCFVDLKVHAGDENKSRIHYSFEKCGSLIKPPDGLLGYKRLDKMVLNTAFPDFKYIYLPIPEEAHDIFIPQDKNGKKRVVRVEFDMKFVKPTFFC